MKNRLPLFISLWLAANAGHVQAQLIWRARQDSSIWLRATAAVQVWSRYTDHNPGSAMTFGSSSYGDLPPFDVGIRRARFQLFGNVSKRAFIFAHFGINNFNSLAARKAGAFFHDLTAEYVIVERALNIGGGLSGWSGLSRYASPAIASTLMYDAPLYQQATNDVNEQFLRKLGLFAKGQVGSLDYRFALSKPMAIQQAVPMPDTTVYDNKATFSPLPAKLQYQGYAQWQFLEKENNLTPYTAGSYLGSKRILNLGAGVIAQPGAMRYRRNSAIQHSAMVLAGVDIFLDYYINPDRRNAITMYGAYNRFDFGPSHTRPLGVMNPANGSLRPEIMRVSGPGNSYTMFGTGNVYYVQAGYKLRDGLFAEHGTLQPFADIFVGDYEGLDVPCLVWNAGVNWLISGNNAKVSLNYQERPVYVESPAGSRAKHLSGARRGMAVLQMQVYF